MIILPQISIAFTIAFIQLIFRDSTAGASIWTDEYIEIHAVGTRRQTNKVDLKFYKINGQIDQKPYPNNKCTLSNALGRCDILSSNKRNKEIVLKLAFLRYSLTNVS